MEKQKEEIPRTMWSIEGKLHGQRPRSWDQLGSGGTRVLSCQRTTQAKGLLPHTLRSLSLAVII